jgi:hypothetical protein
MTKELIIAAYDRNLGWVSSLNSDVKQTIYRKGFKGAENEIFIEPNLGRCVHTFFNHIYLNYDTNYLVNKKTAMIKLLTNDNN